MIHDVLVQYINNLFFIKNYKHNYFYTGTYITLKPHKRPDKKVA